ncbi:MAG: hypothetical protein JWQ27_1948 [Ferruginibacter sp.]|nr:hypothetical protein [Ferruginibacter sp.]
MELTVYYILMGLTQVPYLLGFIFSLRTINNKSVPHYMRNFYWYSVVGVIIVCMYWMTRVDGRALFVKIHWIALVFHLIFLGQFILYILPKKSSLLSASFKFIVLIVTISLIVKIQLLPTFMIFTISNLTLLVLCVIYYINLFRSAPTVFPLTEPSFWVVTGIFLGMGISFPITIFLEFLGSNSIFRFMKVIMLINMIPYAIMHLSFVKAYQCSIQPKLPFTS